MKEPKFKIGDVLKPIIDSSGLTQLHVVETLVQTCPGGEQIRYTCRVYSRSTMSLAPAISKPCFDFNEIEVELWKSKENENAV